MASVINTLMTDTGSNKTKTQVQTGNLGVGSATGQTKTNSGSSIKTMQDIQNNIDKVKQSMGITQPATTSQQAAQNRQTVANAVSNLVNNAKAAWNNAVSNKSTQSASQPFSSSSGSSYSGGGGSYGGGGYADTGYVGTPASYSIGSDPSLALRTTDPAAAATTQNIVNGIRQALGTYNIAPVDYVDIAQQKAELASQKNLQEAQLRQQVDYAVSQGITELMRNVEDAKQAFQTQRNQVNADERRALDNQVLYSEARGDRGGIGQAQYGAIQNTAAVQRLAVNQAETKLQTDTNRQIADLRAQGEFTKADKLLEIAQNYQSQLMNLEMWAKEQNVSIQEFNAGLYEWQAEYQRSVAQLLADTELSAAQITGAFSTGQRTYNAIQTDREMLANAAASLVQAGVAPTIEQLNAMGWTPSQATDYLYGYYPYGIQST